MNLFINCCLNLQIYFTPDLELKYRMVSHDNDWDVVGIVMILLCCGVIFWGIFLAPCLMFIEMDPVYFLIFLSRQYFPTLPIPTPSHPVCIIVRLVLQIPVLMNSFRTMLFVFLTFVLATKLQVSHLNNIGRGFQSVYRINMQITQRLQMYRVFYLFIQIINADVVSPIAATLLGIAMNLEILAVFICLRMYRLVLISASTFLVYEL